MSDYPQYRNPFVAALLSAVIPGLGQLYNGRIGVGVLTLIIYGFGIGIATISLGLGILIVIVTWFAAVIGAYNYAKSENQSFEFEKQNLEHTIQMAKLRAKKEKKKKCPDCAEMVLSKARKCRFCGFEFKESETFYNPIYDDGIFV